jgi:transcriptional regulator with XRE-family HTH domain
MSEYELARRARVSRIHLRNLQAGKSDATIGVAWRIAQALGVSLTELLAGNSGGK